MMIERTIDTLNMMILYRVNCLIWKSAHTEMNHCYSLQEVDKIYQLKPNQNTQKAMCIEGNV